MDTYIQTYATNRIQYHAAYPYVRKKEQPSKRLQKNIPRSQDWL